MRIRKKLTMTIITLIVNWLVVYAAQQGLELTEEQQLTLVKWGLAASAFIIGLFNHGQGLADKGKEAGRILLMFFLCSSLMALPLTVWAQPANEFETCKGDYQACRDLLNECDGADCPVAVCPDCEKICDAKCGWVTLVKDKTFMTTVLGSVVFLVGGIAGIFLAPQQ